MSTIRCWSQKLSDILQGERNCFTISQLHVQAWKGTGTVLASVERTWGRDWSWIQASNCSVCCSKLHATSTDPQPKSIKHITKIKAISGLSFLKALLRWNQIPLLSCKRGYAASCQCTFRHRWWAGPLCHLKEQNDSEAQWGYPRYQKQSVFREIAFQPPAQGCTTPPQRGPETRQQFLESRAPWVADLPTDGDWQCLPRGPSNSPQRESITCRG